MSFAASAAKDSGKRKEKTEMEKYEALEMEVVKFVTKDAMSNEDEAEVTTPIVGEDNVITPSEETELR